MFVKRTLPLASVVFANLMVGVLIQLFVMRALGAGTQTDALFASLLLPQLVLLVTSGPLARVIVPLLSAIGDEDRLRRETWTLLHVAAGAASALALVLAATAPLWVPLLFPGLGAEARDLTVALTRIQLIGVAFSVAVTVLSAFHHAGGRFVRVEAAILVTAIAGFAVIVETLPVWGVAGVVWVSVGRLALQSAMLVPGLGAYRRPVVLGSTLPELRRRAAPLLAGALYYKNERLVDRLLSSMGPSGSLSILALGHQGYTVTAQILYRALTAQFVPQLTRQAEANVAGFRSTYRRALAAMLAVTTAGCLLFAGAGEPLLRLIFLSGRMTQADVHQLWLVMVALGGSVVAGGCGQIVAAAYYSRGDTWTPTKVGIAAFTLGIPLRALGFWMFGVVGIAVGGSLYHIVNTTTLLILLEGSARATSQPSTHTPVRKRAAVQ
jgi:putative peptidoglycan lipid II flippase